jgi:hypothetical protein
VSLSCYINEFRPLANSPSGRKAIEQFGLPPFIDASCRREPDLESELPSITALCRKEFFAPHLREGDVVAYMTANFEYPPKTASVRRLVAILRIKKSWLSHRKQRGLEAHDQAAAWYLALGLPIPSNCMTSASSRKPLDQTDRFKPNIEEWDDIYRLRAIQCGAFHACEKIFCEVNDPPRLTNRQLVKWFGTIPDTRSLPTLPPRNFVNLLVWLAGQPASSTHRQHLETLIALFNTTVYA